jgi:hypothetical protein
VALPGGQRSSFQALLEAGCNFMRRLGVGAAWGTKVVVAS